MHWAVLLLIGAPLASSPDRCDLRVLVEDFNGGPARVPVVLVSDSGKVIAEAQSDGGVAEFCDVGLGNFSAVIGGEVCGQVVLRHLYVRGPNTLMLRAVHKNCHAQYVSSPCAILLRVTDEAGRRLPGATVEENVSRYPLTTDRYGRVFSALRYGLTSAIRVSLAGYQTKETNIACTEETPRIEETVILKRKKQ